jgi:hypothetical protein
MSTQLAPLTGKRHARNSMRRISTYCHAHNEVQSHLQDAISATLCKCYEPTPDDVCAAFTALESILAAMLDKKGLPGVKQSICDRHAKTLSQALAVFHSQS